MNTLCHSPQQVHSPWCKNPAQQPDCTEIAASYIHVLFCSICFQLKAAEVKKGLLSSGDLHYTPLGVFTLACILCTVMHTCKQDLSDIILQHHISRVRWIFQRPGWKTIKGLKRRNKVKRKIKLNSQTFILRF